LAKADRDVWLRGVERAHLGCLQVLLPEYHLRTYSPEHFTEVSACRKS
jgi:hypothetical protein